MHCHFSSSVRRQRSLGSRLALGALLALGVAAGASAQSGAAGKWPEKPLRMYVGFAAGTSTDVVARMLAEGIAPGLGQPVVVENRAGASATIAANTVAHAAPDGYSLVLGTPSAHATAPYVFQNLPYDPIRDLIGVGLVGNTYYALIANLDMGAGLKDMIAIARSGKLRMNYASVGEGSISHMGGMIFSEQAGFDATHIPYKGTAQSLTDLVGGRIQSLFTSVASAMPLHKAGKARILAIPGPRQSVLPDVPAMKEVGFPDFQMYFWLAAFTTAGTPNEIVQKLNREINAAVKGARMSKSLTEIGVVPETMTPPEILALVKKDAESFRQFVVKAGLKPQPL